MLSIRYMKTDLSRRIVFWTGHDMKIIRAIGCTLLVNKILHLYISKISVREALIKNKNHECFGSESNAPYALGLLPLLLSFTLLSSFTFS